VIIPEYCLGEYESAVLRGEDIGFVSSRFKTTVVVPFIEPRSLPNSEMFRRVGNKVGNEFFRARKKGLEIHLNP
jgi:hypothetical protein